MPLTEDSTKDTYIKLIMFDRGNDNEVMRLDESYVAIDITDQVKSRMKNFDAKNILGIKQQSSNSCIIQTLYYEEDLLNRIKWAVERLLDASIVNEKQKKALKELLWTELYDSFEHKRKTLDLALSLE